ncbi:hypothetical protein LCGC14_3030260 [marine sediment metagenome]|uniref:Uncharacterized protein n=1 Tax=marine sediment metagenome TaxID=412755 RepID=A0A0F8WT23_9ZZZZ
MDTESMETESNWKDIGSGWSYHAGRHPDEWWVKGPKAYGGLADSFETALIKRIESLVYEEIEIESLARDVVIFCQPSRVIFLEDLKKHIESHNPRDKEKS